MRIEFELSERLAPELNVRVCEQKIGAETEQTAHRIRLTVQNGFVKLTSRNEVPTRGSERALPSP